MENKCVTVLGNNVVTKYVTIMLHLMMSFTNTMTTTITIMATNAISVMGIPRWIINVPAITIIITIIAMNLMSAVVSGKHNYSRIGLLVTTTAKWSSTKHDRKKQW